ncbi:MAG TPA: PP2C family protein-serine/threonine phosphatase [Bryobacteraceae bacterium]|nr:PP2C family protein-serine/threonine phosphatase [Bryobacteraceae bacterium]
MGSAAWAMACDVQQRFMQNPAAAPDNLDYSARCRQAQELGGDCYDFVPLRDGCLAIAVGDASGKGLAAALMISNVQASLRTAALFHGNDGAATLGTVNRHVYATSLTDRYATLFYGVFDETAGSLRYVNAGHTPPIVIRRDGFAERLEAGGAPVGMFADWPYEEGAVQLDPEDLVVAYTDGVTEAENPLGEMWGVGGLLRAAAENRARSTGDIVKAIFRAMDEFTRGRQTDDATVVVVRRRSQPARRDSLPAIGTTIAISSQEASGTTRNANAGLDLGCPSATSA